MKSSYEELEEQLNRSRRLCDAALANERVWETTMMEACGEDGPASVAAEIKALRAQRDTAMESLRQQLSALAAENAGLKDINAWCKTDAFKNMYREFKTAEAIGCHDVDCMHDAMLTAIMHAPKTPATDAFLAEVLAHDLNAFIRHHSAELDAHIKNGGEQFDEKSARIRDIIVSARLFREQIRKEAAQ